MEEEIKTKQNKVLGTTALRWSNFAELNNNYILLRLCVTQKALQSTFFFSLFPSRHCFRETEKFFDKHFTMHYPGSVWPR